MIEFHGKLDEIIKQLDSLHMYPSERRDDDFVLTIWHSDELRRVKPPHKDCKICKLYLKNIPTVATRCDQN